MVDTLERRWISYREAQEVSGLSRGTLWKLVEAGHLPAAKVGRRVLLDAVGLHAYLESLAKARR